MRLSASHAVAACSLLTVSGCLAPWNFRLPTLYNNRPEIERIEQQYHDPYPDSQMGPSTGTRPLQYNDQRPLPVRIREKSDVSRILGDNGRVIPPPVSPGAGSQYPATVPF